MKKLAIALVFVMLFVGSAFASPRQNTNSAPMNNGGHMGRRHHRRHHRRHRRHHRRAARHGNTNS